jgi:hypothetical protein
MHPLLCVFALCLLSGCELLQNIPLLPSVKFKEAALIQSPSQQKMAAYYCPQVVPNPIPGAAAVACGLSFGLAPGKDDMNVAFRLSYGVENPNRFPIPVAEMLTAVTIFPDQSHQDLGATCLVFCAPGDTTCTGKPGPHSCQSRDEDIRSAEDFAQATTDLLISNGVQLATGQTPTFELPSVNAESEADIAALFSFGPDPMLEALKQLALQSVNQLASGQQVTFEVPYRLEGTVWLDVGSLGKVAVGYGPIEGTWVP